MTDGFQRQVEGYIHGEHGRIVVVPGRVAAWLEKRCGLNELRVSVRGCDSEVDSVLMALRLAALEWRSAATGTETTASAEPPAISEAWVTTTQAAGMLGISDRAIRKAIAENRIPATRVGNAWRIAREDLEHYRAARKVA
ncbi:helix-turn-helix domain-containing protein [Gordonia sputi]